MFFKTLFLFFIFHFYFLANASVDMVPVSNVEEFSSHGRLRMLFANITPGGDSRVFWASATMVSDTCVLTAAHNVFVRNDTEEDKQHRMYHRKVPYEILFFPAFHDGCSPISYSSYNPCSVSSKVKQYHIHPKWTNEDNDQDESYTYDIAVLELKYKIGLKTGWYTVCVESNDYFRNAAIHLKGYPDYLNYQGRRMCTAFKLVEECEDDKCLHYKIKTHKGQSGGGIHIGEDLLGVYSYNYSDSNGAFIYSNGVRVTEEIK